MNFKRIQWIFIIAFVLLDIGLCISLLMGTQFHNSGRQQSQSQITMKEMKNDMISFGSLSNHRQDGYYIAAQDNNQWTSNSRVTALKNQSSHLNNGLFMGRNIPIASSYQINGRLSILKLFMGSQS